MPKKKVTVFGLYGTLERDGIGEWVVRVKQLEPPYELTEEQLIAILSKTQLAEDIEEDEEDF